MKRGRRPNPEYDVPEDLKVILCPVPESHAEFQKRKNEVQTMIAKIILLGKKRGRPSYKEETYEEVA
jgi:hypothetical protein